MRTIFFNDNDQNEKNKILTYESDRKHIADLPNVLESIWICFFEDSERMYVRVFVCACRHEL